MDSVVLIDVIAIVEKYALTLKPTPKITVDINGKAQILRLILIIFPRLASVNQMYVPL